MTIKGETRIKEETFLKMFFEKKNCLLPRKSSINDSEFRKFKKRCEHSKKQATNDEFKFNVFKQKQQK